MPVSPNECEGVEEISPDGRNDKTSELRAFAPLRENFQSEKLLI